MGESLMSYLPRYNPFDPITRLILDESSGGSGAASGVQSFSNFADRPTGLAPSDAGTKLLFAKTGNFHEWDGTKWIVLDESYINVLDYGAGAGAANDTLLLQPVFDSVRDTGEATWGESSNKVKRIYFPGGFDYKIETTLLYYSSFWITGDGATSKLVTTNPNLGSFLVMEENILASPANSHWLSRVEFLHFVDNSTLTVPGVPNMIAMIRNQTGKTANNCCWGNLWQGCALGVISDLYSQYCEASRFFATQKVEQFIDITGNDNTLIYIDKEGASPITTLPFILLQRGVDLAAGNRIINCLVEGGGLAGKPAIELIECIETHIENIWNEFGLASSATTTIKATDSITTRIIGYYHGSNLKRIELIGKSDITIEELNYGSTTATSFHDLFILEPNCTVRINKLITRTNLDIGLLNKSRQFIVDSVVQNDIADASPAARAGYCNTQKIHESNSVNRFTNGSFSAGLHGWSVDGSPVTSLVGGLIGSGNSLQIDKADGGTVTLRQNFITTADMIGQVFTLSFYARIVSGNAGAVINPNLSGGGITFSTGFSQAKAIGSTTFIQQSFEIQTAGTIQVGARFNGITSAIVDHFCLNAGLVSGNGSGEVQDLALNNLFMGSGAFSGVSPPGAGSWEKGDLFLSKAAAIGSTPFIQCTTAGEGTAAVWAKAPELKEGRDVITVTGVTTVTFPVVTLPGTPVFTPAVPAAINRVYSLNTGQLAAWDGTQYIATTSSLRGAWSGNTGAANIPIEPTTTSQKLRRDGLTGLAKDPISQLDTTSIGVGSRTSTAAAVTQAAADCHIRLTSVAAQTLTLIDPTVTPQADKLLVVSNPSSIAKAFAVAVTNMSGVAQTAMPARSTLLLQCVGTVWIIAMQSAPMTMGVVTLDAQAFNTNVFTASTNGSYVLPVAGTYLLQYNVSLDGTGANDNSHLAIFDSTGNLVPGTMRARGGGVTTAQVLSAVASITITAAETYTIRGRNGGSGSVTILNNAYQSQISWQQIS